MTTPDKFSFTTTPLTFTIKPSSCDPASDAGSTQRDLIFFFLSLVSGDGKFFAATVQPRFGVADVSTPSDLLSNDGAVGAA